jgi:hypothetical protein
MFLAVKAFSYPGDYVAQQPSIERIAETLDKFEEDVLEVKTATIRGARRVNVVFGEPISVNAERGARMSASSLTIVLEQRIQQMLDACQPTPTTSATDTSVAHRAAM